MKPLSAAKSRLAHPHPGELALAFLQDVLSAVFDTPAVAEAIVATSDDRVAAAAEHAGARIVDDRAHPGINAAAAWAARNRLVDGGLAVMVADLPCLTPTALSVALGLAGRYPASFLADADGEGTTMWFATGGSVVEPAFGPASRLAHVTAGAVDLVTRHPDERDALAPARRDVDTEADLAQAAAWGLGPASRRLVR